jgi:hypothetical protein
MRIWKNIDCLTIQGSLAKYLHDENITPLNREGVKQAIEKLEQDIGLNLKNAVVCSAEFGASIVVNERPFEYLHLFGYTNRLGRYVISDGNINKTARREVSNWKGVETVIYTTQKGSFEFIGYDKIKEMFAKKQEIPSFYNGLNVLRLEYKMRKRRGIEAKFKGGLSAYDIFGETVYRRWQELFYDKYKSIGKMGRLVYADTPEEITPAKFKKIIAEQFRQSHAEEYHYHLQRFIEAGKTTPKNLEMIRAENNKMGNDIYISDPNHLIKELDALVYIAMFGD